jgi:uncharacterized protein (TIGR02118 family)
MAGAKIIVLYPHPTDAAAFEKVYMGEHAAMARHLGNKTGALKMAATKFTETPQGKPLYYRMFEFHYPSMEKLQAALGDPDTQKTVGHANQISTGGAPIIMVSAESQDIGA